MNITQWQYDSEFGPIFILASEVGLAGVLWKPLKKSFVKNLDLATSSGKIIEETKNQISEYFKGRRKFFDLPIDIKGTEFQKNVWKELSKIPYGKTYSYGEIAHKIKNSKAFRAVGTANGKNPLMIIVPCHRVIAANGRLGGYAGGESIKAKLLQIEKTHFRNLNKS